jgi:hypothetical protein
MFADVAVSAGVAADHYDNEALPYGAGVIIFDFDGDGFQDIFVPDRLGPDVLYRNSGNGALQRCCCRRRGRRPRSDGEWWWLRRRLR